LVIGKEDEGGGKKEKKLAEARGFVREVGGVGEPWAVRK
jgi:hypothetical protein